MTNGNGRVVVESLNGLLAYICPADGTFAIGIHDKEYRGGADMFYRLHVGDVPIVTSVLPMGVQRGTESSVRLVGVNLRTATAMLKVPADAAIGTRVPIPLGEKNEKPLGDASVVVGEFPEVIAENVGATIPLPGTANGVIGKPGETQAIRFIAKKGEQLLIEVNARRAGSPLDSDIEVLEATSKTVGRRPSQRCDQGQRHCEI